MLLAVKSVIAPPITHCLSKVGPENVKNVGEKPVKTRKVITAIEMTITK